MDDSRPSRRIFSLHDAQQLLPEVRRITSEAVERSERIAGSIEELADSDPERPRLVEELNDVVNGWAAKMRQLELEVKGLWLVDFDNGDGFYCWMHPEPSVTHYHTYEDGFQGRMKIT